MLDDKWPTLTVVGPPVTREQAELILIRTCDLDLHCNDRAWTAAAHRILTNTEHPWYLDTPEGRIAALKEEWAAKDRYRILWLHYLGQDRVANAAKGSSGAWCDWDGTIGGRPYSIGKWPGESDITEDWTQIAEAFPFLRLRSQVVSLDDKGGPDHVWGTWTIADGVSTFDEDATELLDLPEPTPWAMGRQPMTLGELQAVVDRVRAVTPEREPGPQRARRQAVR